MRFGSLFAGIGGLDRGFELAGIECLWQVEIDDQCIDVLTRHWPNVERYKDVRDFGKFDFRAVDIISGGFPCQDVSVAGRREGLAGERSGLWFEFHRVLEVYRPSWVVVENVHGLLSSNGGRDFATILQGLEKLGYGVVYRILDAQYFGVPQRRRRVFIIGSLGDHRSIEVLFESESLSGNSKARKKKRKKTAATLRSRSSKSGVSIPGRGGEDDENLIVARSVRPKSGMPQGWNANLMTGPIAGGAYGSGRRTEDDPNLVISNPITTHMKRYDTSVETLITGTVSSSNRNLGSGSFGDTSGKLLVDEDQIGVRRLTPLECERLQGFADGWTDGHSDTARYKMIGNAVCVSVAQWIGERIMEFDNA